MLNNNISECGNSSPFSYTFPTSDEDCVVFVAPSFKFSLKSLPLREDEADLSSTVLEAALYALYSISVGAGLPSACLTWGNSSYPDTAVNNNLHVWGEAGTFWMTPMN